MEYWLSFESVIRGHHVYKFVWTPFIGEILSLGAEDGMKMILCSGFDKGLLLLAND